jgi:type VI protein secretion system component Hcp
MTTSRGIAVLAVAAMAALAAAAAVAKNPKGRDLASVLQPVGRLTIMNVADTPTNIYSVGFEATNAATVSGGGGGAGRPAVDKIVVSRLPDVVSAELFKATIQGQFLPGARIEVYAAGTTTVQTSYVLGNVLVTRLSGADGIEEVEFDFQTIEFSVNGASYCFDTVTLGGC